MKPFPWKTYTDIPLLDQRFTPSPFGGAFRTPNAPNPKLHRTPKARSHSFSRLLDEKERRAVKVLLFSFLSSFLAFSSPAHAYTWEGVPAGYGLAWSDEFNGAVGSAPNPANWNYDTGASGWGNNELENYTTSTANSQVLSDPNAVDGKALGVIAIDTTPGNPTYNTVGRYTSARLLSSGKQTPQYGYMVARIRMPYGQGIWPAYWMLGTNIGSVGWPACDEIDIMENIGQAADQATNHGSLHDGSDVSTLFTLPGGQLYHNDYHTFAALWQANQIQFYVDGNLYATDTSANLNNTWLFNHPNFFLLNCAVGGQWPGNPDATTSFPQTMLVDYVRVYQSGQPTPVPVVQSTWRVRCGGPSYLDSQGNTWSADTNFTGGWPAATGSAISGALPNGSDQALYQYERYGSNTGGTTVTYTFNVPAGSYQATLKFSENYWTAAGQRIFNVSINGNPALANFDILSSAGGQFKAIDRVFNGLTPNGSGQIVIQLVPGGADMPKVDAIQILSIAATPTSTSTLTFTPTLSNTPTKTWTPTATDSFTSTKTFSPTASATGTASSTPSATATNTPIPPTATPTATGTASRTSTPSATATGTPSSTVTSSGTPTRTSTGTFTPTFTSTNSATPSPTASSTKTGTPTLTGTFTLSPTGTLVPTSTETSTGTSTATGTSSPTPSATSSKTPTLSATPTSTAVDSATPSSTASATASGTSSSTPTPTWTASLTSSPTRTPTATGTSSATASFTSTFTVTRTFTFSNTPTWTWTPTGTPTPTATLTFTPSNSPTFTPTATSTATSIPNSTPVVYPNPSNGEPVQIQLFLRQASDVRVQIYTASFRKVGDQSFADVLPGGTVSVAWVDRWGHPLASGLYYFAVEDNQGRFILKALLLR